MSYILDALRRAEAERERGQVPGVHTQPAPSEVQAGAAQRQRVWLLTVAAALALLLVGALSARWLASPPSKPAPAPAPAAPSLHPAAVTPPALAQPAPELVRLAPPAADSVPPTRTAAAPPRKPETAVPVLASLPEALRRQLPSISTGGAMYSDTPSKRMLIINGQLYQEGATVAPGLVLEQIKLNSAVLAFHGQRFSIAY